MTVFVSIALASICFTYNGTQECHSALLGKPNSVTPVGEFTIDKINVPQKGYGGNVLRFYENDEAIWAIHRVYLGNPAEKRLDRLKGKNLKDKFITNGCINVLPEVYDKLVACCENSALVIK